MRITVLLLFFALHALWMSATAQSSSGSLQITVTGIRNNNGKILCSLFKEGEGYPDQPTLAFYKTSAVIKDRKALISVDGLPIGYYAVALLHDENGDNKMNTSLVGLPKEGYGFSNNVMGLFGPPPFSKASFRLISGEHKTIQINLRY